MLTPGDVAPQFSLTNQNNVQVELAALRGQRVLIFFYPRASTPGCTQQACAVRDAADQFGGTVVLGVSPDSVKAIQGFAVKQSLPYDLLSDADHAVAEAYGAWRHKKLYGKEYYGVERSAFIVAADGTLEAVKYKISPKSTPAFFLGAEA
jgi:thioredoxin-dependent peroxiredoxin